MHQSMGLTGRDAVRAPLSSACAARFSPRAAAAPPQEYGSHGHRLMTHRDAFSDGRRDFTPTPAEHRTPRYTTGNAVPAPHPDIFARTRFGQDAVRTTTHRNTRTGDTAVFTGPPVPRRRGMRRCESRRTA